MLDKLNEAMQRYEEVNAALMKPEVISDRKVFASLSKEMKSLEKIFSQGREYKKVLEEIEASKKIIAGEKDEELVELAENEIAELENKKFPLEESLKKLLIPKDPEDSKNAILEIRAGTGGDEACLFAGDLFRMYTRYCEGKKWKVELIDVSEGPKGGFKEIIAEVNGEDVYGTLKFESGVHRVQRVPKTETNGRIHTSAATVAVLPEAEEVDIEIKNSDIRKDTFMSGGPGGQSVNTTYSAIRLTHIPTGLVVSCQDEKSQIKNYEKALRVLRSRLYEMEMEKRNAEIASKRKSLVSTGDRSAKIRTYNFPQSRVTDHRIGLTIHNLDAVLDGDIGEMIEQLRGAESAEKMKA